MCRFMSINLKPLTFDKRGLYELHCEDTICIPWLTLWRSSSWWAWWTCVGPWQYLWYQQVKKQLNLKYEATRKAKTKVITCLTSADLMTFHDWFFSLPSPHKSFLLLISPKTKHQARNKIYQWWFQSQVEQNRDFII